MNLLTFLYREGKGMSKFRSILIALAACAAVMTAAVPPSEADTNTTVRFRSGGDSASYTGRIRGDETARYVLDARRGQTMQVLLSAGNPQAYFNVVLPDSQEALFNGATSGNSFSGKLPQNGRYVIEVYLTRAAARRNEESSYSIDIAIPASSGGKAPAEDFADGDAGGPDNWIVTGIAPNDKLNVRSAPSATGWLCAISAAAPSADRAGAASRRAARAAFTAGPTAASSRSQAAGAMTGATHPRSPTMARSGTRSARLVRRTASARRRTSATAPSAPSTVRAMRGVPSTTSFPVP
jgi:hypothetical protein